MKNKILIVGDLHCDWDSLNELIKQEKPEIVLQCGDFGWWPVLNGKNNWNLKGIETNKSKIYWCDGNHEEFSYLIQNGLINQMYHNVFHCARGSTLKLPDGRIVLFIGGASSVDRNHRTMGYDLFFQENISLKDLDYSLSHKRVDIVISHTCPNEFEISGLNIFGKINDGNRKALSNILNKYKPKLWFFGHWHKFEKGKYNNTKWYCLDYPSNGDKWWLKL